MRTSAWRDRALPELSPLTRCHLGGKESETHATSPEGKRRVPFARPFFQRHFFGLQKCVESAHTTRHASHDPKPCRRPRLTERRSDCRSSPSRSLSASWRAPDLHSVTASKSTSSSPGSSRADPNSSPHQDQKASTAPASFTAAASVASNNLRAVTARRSAVVAKREPISHSGHRRRSQAGTRRPPPLNAAAAAAAADAHNTRGCRRPLLGSVS